MIVENRPVIQGYRAVILENRAVIHENRAEIHGYRAVIHENRPVIVGNRPVIVEYRPVIVENRVMGQHGRKSPPKSGQAFTSSLNTEGTGGPMLRTLASQVEN